MSFYGECLRQDKLVFGCPKVFPLGPIPYFLPECPLLSGQVEGNRWERANELLGRVAELIKVLPQGRLKTVTLAQCLAPESPVSGDQYSITHSRTWAQKDDIFEMCMKPRLLILIRFP